MKNVKSGESKNLFGLLTIVIGLIPLGSTLAAIADTAPPLTVAQKNVLEPAPPGSVSIAGRLGDKLDLCINNRLLAQDISAVVTPYRAKAETGSADWRCEYWGKWYTSLALADAYRSTPKSRAMVATAAKALIATAAPDGYLGTRVPKHRLEGWDVWGCKYALLGVLAYYDRTHDPEGLKAARRQGDVLINELGPGKTNIEDVGEWNGLPASSILEPIVQLYERTGDRKYLDFAEYIVTSWTKPSKRLANGMRLIDDVIAGKLPAEMCAPKAYEMMSCFEGLCELYRATGERKYLDASIDLGDKVSKAEATLIGCGTSGEIWFNGHDKQTSIVMKPMETCVTATWMKLEYQLLRLTGDSKYADELEKNLYNGLLGAMMKDGRWWAYFSGLMGVRVPSYVQHSDVELSCCVVNGPRGLMLTPFWAYMTNADGPVVNLYGPGSAHLKTPGGQPVILRIPSDAAGDYPANGNIRIVVTPKKPEEFSVSLRIPGWSVESVVKVNGEAVAVRSGSYAAIHRRWKAGDEISVNFDMRGRILDAPDGNGQVALARGPMILSLDNRITPAAAAGSASIDRTNTPFIALTPNPVAAAKIGAWMAFDAPVTGTNAPAMLTFTDYADAGSDFTEQNIFRTWLPQPLDLHEVYNTGQTWNTLSHAKTWTNPPEPFHHVDHPDADLALAINGATVTSDSEYDMAAGCTARLIDGIVATPDNFSNRWHSSLDIPHPHWAQVKLPRPQKISSVVLYFADPAGYPTSFQGIATVDGREKVIFDVSNNKESRVYRAQIPGVRTDTVRVVIRASRSTVYPNAAQLSEIAIYK